MSPTLTPDADIDELLDDPDAETIRTSEFQRQSLERRARALAGSDLSLSFTTDESETTKVDYQPDPPEITIPAWKIPQPVTNLDRLSYDSLMQHMLTLHEIGHLRYTDEEISAAAAESVDNPFRSEYRQFFNALEDGAVEEHLRNDFAVDTELAVMNANYLSRPEGDLGMLDCILASCIDLSVFDTGTLRQLADPDEDSVQFASESDRELFEEEIFETIIEAVRNVRNEPDPEARVQAIRQAWDQIQPHLEEADDPSGGQTELNTSHPAPADGGGEPTTEIEDATPPDTDERLSEFLDSMDSVNMDASGANQSKNQEQPDISSETSPESGDNNTTESGEEEATASPDNSPGESAGEYNGSGAEPATTDERDNINGIEGESEGGEDGTRSDTADVQSATNNDDEGQNPPPSPRPESTDQPNSSDSPQAGGAEGSSSNKHPEHDENRETDSTSSGNNPDTETSEDQDLESENSPPASSETASNEGTSPSTADPEDGKIASEETGESSSQDHSDNDSEAGENMDTDEYEDSESDNATAQATDIESQSEGDDTEDSSETPNEESDLEAKQSGSADSPDSENIVEDGRELEQDQVTEAGTDESVEQESNLDTDISGDSSADTSDQSDTEGTRSTEPKPDNAPISEGKGTGGGEIDLSGSENSEEVSSTAEDTNKSESDETEPNSETWTDDIDSDPEIDEDLLSEYESMADRQERHQEEINAQIEQELESLQETLDQIDDISVRELEVVDGPGTGSYRSSETTEIKRDATQLARILERRLNKEERSDFRNDRRQGTVDTRVVHRLKFQDFRVFKEETSPDDKDYDVVFVLDRSGSMTSDMQAAENATATLLLALEEIDIDTCLIDVYRSKPRVAKPFGVDVEAKLDSILTDVNSGGTPLTPCLELAREHLRKRRHYPFMIVVTDGRPSNESAYKEELKRTNFPVLGVYLDFTANSVDDVPKRVRDSGELFDRRKIITDEDDLASSLRQLCEGVMF